jgi:hypothetical protein
LERCHSYKDKVTRGIAANHGLFAYPVLMTADILLFQSEKVPVGKDQKQHVEVARDIAIKFNNEYGDIFTLPEPEIDEEVATVPGLDGQKMSKSYGNTIDLFAERQRPAQAGDAHRHRPDPGGGTEGSGRLQRLQIYRLFLDKGQDEALRDRYQAGGLAYGEVKQELFETVRNHFAHTPRGARSCWPTSTACGAFSRNVADVLHAGDVHQQPLEAMRPKPACGQLPQRRVSRYHQRLSGAIPALLHPAHQHIVALLALAAADDLADPRHQQVHGRHGPFVVVEAHVKGLELRPGNR